MKYKKISVIIPAYNEMATIGAILHVVSTWKRSSEIIVIDDGSTDQTSQTVLQYSKKIVLIRNKKNVGKSKAMIEGIIRARGTLIMFLDGDLYGLTHENLDALLQPMISRQADMVIGTRQVPLLMDHFFRPFGGERVFKKSELLKLVPKMEEAGFGVEVVFNEAYNQKRVRYVALPNVYHAIKLKKYSFPEALFFYVKEGFEVIPRYVLYLLRLMMAHE